jgi:SAM-dependent methyltransferase
MTRNFVYKKIQTPSKEFLNLIMPVIHSNEKATPPFPAANVSCPCCSVQEVDYRAKYRLNEFDSLPHWVVQCSNCQLHFMNPMPDISWLENYYRQRALYGAESDFSEDYRNSIADKQFIFNQLLLPNFSDDPAGKLAVDFGAGSGYVVKAFCNLGLDGIGLELNPSAPSKARALFDVDVRNGGLELLADSSVTIFSIFEVLEHMTEPVDFLRSVRPKLQPDSLLIGTVPNYYGLGRYIFGIDSSVLSQPEHVIYFDSRTLDKTLRSAGYVPLFIGPYKPNQVIIGFGMRQFIYKYFGRNFLTNFLVFCIGQSKKYLAYPLVNMFVEKTGKLAHGLTFVARPQSSSE